MKTSLRFFSRCCCDDDGAFGAFFEEEEDEDARQRPLRPRVVATGLLEIIKEDACRCIFNNDFVKKGIP
jgi:hypothetical protein